MLWLNWIGLSQLFFVSLIENGNRRSLMVSLVTPLHLKVSQISMEFVIRSLWSSGPRTLNWIFWTIWRVAGLISMLLVVIVGFRMAEWTLATVGKTWSRSLLNESWGTAAMGIGHCGTCFLGYTGVAAPIYSLLHFQLYLIVFRPLSM